MRYVIVKGNPRDGFKFVGPFDSQVEAGEYADDNLAGEDWWVAELLTP